ncbi:MAG: TolC family protein, partial [Nitrospinae bacterium]|nr:TolC family protein [Nitrospinota bacterium]
HLAKKNRKITRALLVSEVANYDFGIGNSGDLFEALIIYSRVLNGYYESVYNFNLAVAELNRALRTGKH